MASARKTSLRPQPNALRLGLCCQFVREPIRFRTTTATAMLRLPKPARLARLADLCRSRSRLTLENDDRVYTPSDLLPVCADTGVPLVCDVHHHRCLPDGLSVAEITERARKTWPAEPPRYDGVGKPYGRVHGALSN